MTAAAAALACLLPAACDVASASPAYHKPPATARPGGNNNHHGGTKTTSPASATSAPAATDPASADPSAPADPADPVTDPNAPVTDPNAPVTDPNAPVTDPAAPTSDPAATVAPTTAPPAGGTTNGLDLLARDCSATNPNLNGLDAHTGFQVAPACVSTAFGEVADQDKDPSLLITDAPRFVRANTAFTIKVSTRNLVRDRFLGAAAGGYYLESSVLTKQDDSRGGLIQRGHFHTACRMLASTREAPEPGPVPAFFVATQDNGGSSTPDTVTVSVTGLPTRGIAQCTVWAGDGSHRIPMMERANQTPAIDSVRIFVG